MLLRALAALLTSEVTPLVALVALHVFEHTRESGQREHETQHVLLRVGDRQRAQGGAVGADQARALVPQADQDAISVHRDVFALGGQRDAAQAAGRGRVAHVEQDEVALAGGDGGEPTAARHADAAPLVGVARYTASGSSSMRCTCGQPASVV